MGAGDTVIYMSTLSSPPGRARPGAQPGARPLTPEQRRAAELVGKGATRAEAAHAVGRSERTVRAWLKRPELDALVQRVRQETLEPTVAGVLRQALAALTRDGRPDHATRLRAASLLLRNPEVGELAGEEATLPEEAILVYPAALELVAEDDDARA
jgi:DNA-binding CsgD family transcriptional regulator